ncbi:MAG: leucyl/phenylalanyl-tRNA--protein transferase [Deltaproteobacteria bacterium]|nr:MAG: leucyl/phenylalanyl-tRNA--protein transferase [Deltaproteobacteria bacterium]
MPVYQLTEKLIFPPAELAEKDGLLAIGGDLSPERLLLAYSNGIFPWFSEGDPILWWSPSPRLVIFPDEFKIPKRLSRLMRQVKYSVTLDNSFRQVITACATIAGREKKGTWITRDMIEAYCHLHDLGFAHSVECWQDDKLSGGLYGISLGGVFFGESMFSRESNSSKIGLVHLVHKLREWDFDLIDCQMKTEHLIQFGAREIPGAEFQKLLAKSLSRQTQTGKWHLT